MANTNCERCGGTGEVSYTDYDYDMEGNAYVDGHWSEPCDCEDGDMAPFTDAQDVARRIANVSEAFRHYFNDCTSEGPWQALVDAVADDFEASVLIVQTWEFSMGVRYTIRDILAGDLDNPWQ